jgi:uncharacterized iron-regulated membrane protein
MSTRTWFRIHSFTGVITGLMLFVTCWSGTFAVLSAELDWLAGAHWRADEPVRDAGQIDWQGVEATLRDTNTGSEPLRDYLLYLAVPGGTGTLTATVRDAGQQRFELLHLDPGSGALLGVDTLTVQRFFRDFHRRLYFPQPWGLYLVSAFAVTMLVSTVAALVFYKRWWTRFFRFKPGGGRRLWSELHKSIGLWSLWFAAVIVITSLWYLFEGLRVHHGDGVINYVGGDDYAAIQLSEAPSGAETEPLPLAELMARAQQARPDLSVRSLRFEDDGRLYIDGQAGHLLVRDRANQLHLDAATGEVLHSHSADELPLYWRWSDTADPLHFGDFGGLWSKSIWFVFGLLLSALIYTGTYLHARRLARDAQGKKRYRWPGTSAAIVVSLLVIAATVPVGLETTRAVFGSAGADGAKQLPDVATGVLAVILGWSALTLLLIGAWVRMLWRAPGSVEATTRRPARTT